MENELMNIPVVILCGGSGTRLREQTEFIPKPLISIGGVPMVVHIMRIYSYYGFRKFILALGYKQEAFKQYFADYDLINNDVTIDLGYNGGINHHGYTDKGWQVTLADTGVETFKGARLKRIEKYINGDDFFCTYGDGVADIDLESLWQFHKSHGKIATVTGVHPAPRFGEIHHNDLGIVGMFSEKAIKNDCLVNGGFFVFNSKVFSYLSPDEWCDLEPEKGSLSLLAQEGELIVYHHKGYWGCMDTVRDVDDLQILWKMGRAPWKIW